MTDWLPRDPDIDRLLDKARRLPRMEDALPGGDSIGAMMPRPKPRLPDPIPEHELPAWLRRPVHG